MPNLRPRNMPDDRTVVTNPGVLLAPGSCSRCGQQARRGPSGDWWHLDQPCSDSWPPIGGQFVPDEAPAGAHKWRHHNTYGMRSPMFCVRCRIRQSDPEAHQPCTPLPGWENGT